MSRKATCFPMALRSWVLPLRQLLGRVGMGIGSAVVVSGNRGADANMTYTAIGENFRLLAVLDRKGHDA